MSKSKVELFGHAREKELYKEIAFKIVNKITRASISLESIFIIWFKFLSFLKKRAVF